MLIAEEKRERGLYPLSPPTPKGYMCVRARLEGGGGERVDHAHNWLVKRFNDAGRQRQVIRVAPANTAAGQLSALRSGFHYNHNEV